MKFSIRDLLLVTVIVALVVGWGVDRGARAGRDAVRSEYINKLKDALRESLTLNKMCRMQHKSIIGMYPNVQLPPELENEPK